MASSNNNCSSKIGGGGGESKRMEDLSKTLKEGEKFVSPSRRPDGTLRKPIRIRAGYNPPRRSRRLPIQRGPVEKGNADSGSASGL
ncbi:PYM PROTEIN [Salix viminalis]|uniref:PYM PROTEIN n=1 Tax=Salix viminalis TaxID=40686 RepID=A0A9Q0T8K6_SALVM|nr:PYM PROTEIN [Salix viminalis]